MLVTKYNMKDIEEDKKLRDMGVDVKNKGVVEYRYRWMNFSQYVVESWSSDWDVERDCPVILGSLYHKDTKSFYDFNMQYTESQWIDILEQLGYEHKFVEVKQIDEQGNHNQRQQSSP